VSGACYLDTSVVLRAVLEAGTTPEVEARIGTAEVLVTSRLSLVESARALVRVRETFRLPEARLADAEREIDAIWSHCVIWELTAAICESARSVAPRKLLRALDALHLATFLAARRRIAGLELLTVDARLQAAAH
jgi:predicted nucleic acid-binding protein